MDEDFIQLRVVYEDLPSLIELGVVVRCGAWSASSTAFASPAELKEQARKVLEWISSPEEVVQIIAGTATGVGWMVLTFRTVDRSGHARCHVKLATGGQSRDSRPEQTWRIAVELRTELGLIERFAQECAELTSVSSGEARLEGIPD